MITGEEAMEMRAMHRRGMSIRGIARELGLSRGTVRKHLREPGLEPACRARVSGQSKLDPFNGYLLKRIAEAASRRLCWRRRGFERQGS